MTIVAGTVGEREESGAPRPILPSPVLINIALSFRPKGEISIFIAAKRFKKWDEK